MKENIEKYSLVEEQLELYAKTPEGIPLWKNKGVKITQKNFMEQILFLSCDLADYFDIRHDNLCNQNISKLQKTKYFPDQLLKFKQLIEVAKSAKKPRKIYALTRQQTEHLIMDFSGPRAFKKKHDILNRLHQIEQDVINENYEEARKKATNVDGITLLKDHGFVCSVDGSIATIKDISDFLKVPHNTVRHFFHKNNQETKPIKLSREQIRTTGSAASTMNGYRIDDVVKASFWIQSEVGIKLKEKMLSNSGNATLLKQQNRHEIEWRSILARGLDGFGLCYNHPIGRYKVDFYIVKLGIALELDENGHNSYNLEKEEERETTILRHCTLIRFSNDTSVEQLFNAILKTQTKELIRLYP